MAIPEADLVAAADNVFPDLYPFWLVRQIKQKTENFYAAIFGGVGGFLPVGIFPDDDPKTRPVLEAITLLAGYVSGTTEPAATTLMAISEFETIVRFVYNLLTLVNQLYSQSLLTIQQYNVVLAAFNAAYA